MDKVLITGGAGYIGSHCALALLKEGYKVVIFDNLSTGHIEFIETLKEYGDLTFYKVDLSNEESLKDAFDKCGKVDSVIHLAAFSQVGESVKYPEKYYMNNVTGSANLFKQMVNFDIKKLVFSSTASVYGNPISIPITEEHSKEPINPYGETKLSVEQILKEYDIEYGLKSVKLRYFNVAGANSEGIIGEWHEPETHLIPNILNSVKNGEFCIFGDDYDTKDGTCIRDYINIDDIVNAHIKALNYLQNGGTSQEINLGTNQGSSVKEVLALCEKVTGEHIQVKIVKRRDGDPAILVADNKKAKEILGWVPQKSLENSIETAYLWMKKLSDINLNCK